MHTEQHFGGGAVARRFKKQLTILLLTLGGLVLTCLPVAGEETVRLTQNTRGDSKAILLRADEIATWVEGTRRIILMRGNVLVEHGVVHSRMKGGVAWVDPDQTRRTGIMHLELYAEGDVTLENGPQSQVCQKAYLDLFTRGELKLQAHQRKVVKEPHPEDPLYQRGQAEKAGLNPAPAQPVQPVLQRTSYDEPANDDHATQKNPAGVPVQGLAGPPQGQLPSSGPSPLTTPFSPVPMDPGPGPGGGGPAPPGLPAAGPAPPGPPSATAPGPPQAQAVPPPPPGLEREVRIAPRTSGHFEEETVNLPNGEQALIVTGGVILTVRNPEAGIGLIDIESDRLVVWTKGNFQQLLSNLSGPGQRTRQLEFYLAGNVEIREQNGPDSRKITANEAYYNVGRNVAVAYQADLEFKEPGLVDPVHMKAERLEQLAPNEFRGVHAEIFSSRLPSDPGLKIYVSEGTIEEKREPKHSIFGIQFTNLKTGQSEATEQSIFRGRNLFLEADDIPFFYFPYVQGDPNNPLGPLEDFTYGQNNTFGFQLNFTFNLYDLLAVDPIPGTRWQLFTDYMSLRGPALGSTFDYAEKNPFDIPGKLNGLVKGYMIDDHGQDILGGGRGTGDDHPKIRGQFLWRETWELPLDFTLQSQIAVLSDHNFLEQYFRNEYILEYNQETFVYLKQQQDNWAWSVLAEPNDRPWVTETEWLPRTDGYLLGQSLFDRLTYNAHASAGYAVLQTAHGTGVTPPNSLDGIATDQNDSTARFDYWNELSLPFYLGPVKLVPYVIGDATYYSHALNGEDEGRLYGAFGLRQHALDPAVPRCPERSAQPERNQPQDRRQRQLLLCAFGRGL